MGRIIAFREALREAMQEEMRRDDRVFLMGEEVAEYQGAYKVTQGLLDEFGSKRVIDTPITEQGFAGLGVGAAFGFASEKDSGRNFCLVVIAICALRLWIGGGII